jgi:hypothetical protein
MGEVIQLQGDQRKDVQEFLVAKDGLELDAKTIKVCITLVKVELDTNWCAGPRFLNARTCVQCYYARVSKTDKIRRLTRINSSYLRPLSGLSVFAGRCSSHNYDSIFGMR